MVDYILSETHVRSARKQYECTASLWLDAMHRTDIIDTLNFSELRAYAKAKANQFKILKGEPYVKEPMICDGDFFVQRSIPAIRDICIKYDVWSE